MIQALVAAVKAYPLKKGDAAAADAAPAPAMDTDDAARTAR